MRAIVQDKYGAPEVLNLREVNMPEPLNGVGRNVTQFRPGDHVFGEVHSSYAEYVCVAADRIGSKPTNLRFEQAAAVPLAGITALQGLRAWAGNDRFAD